MKKLRLFFLFCIWAASSTIHAQTNRDSLYRKAQMGIYENPDQSIIIGNTLLKTESDINKRITIYIMMSSAYVSKRNFDESLKYILKAKQLLNETKSTKSKVSILTSIAMQYQQMELFSQCLETLDEAETLMRNSEKYKESNFDLGKIFAVRGMVYKSQNNSELALQKFQNSIRYFSEGNPLRQTNMANMSIVYYNMGYAYLNLNKNEEALQNFLKSVEYARKAEAKSLEAFSLKGLADTYTQTGQSEKALQLLQNAEVLSKNVGDLVLNEGIYKGMADNYLILNQPENYRKYNEKYLKTHFEREQSELKSINTSIQNQNAEAAEKMLSLSKKFSFANILLLSAVSLAILFLLWRTYQIRKKNIAIKKQIQDLIQ